MSNCIRKGDCIIIDDGRVLIEYAQNRFLCLEPEAAATITQKAGSGSSLRGIYKTTNGLTFEIDANGKRVSVY